MNLALSDVDDLLDRTTEIRVVADHIGSVETIEQPIGYQLNGDIHVRSLLLKRLNPNQGIRVSASMENTFYDT